MSPPGLDLEAASLMLVLMLLTVYAWFGFLAWITDRWTRRRRLPEPDDPRLRNYLAERHWRAKRELMKRRWVA